MHPEETGLPSGADLDANQTEKQAAAETEAAPQEQPEAMTPGPVSAGDPGAKQAHDAAVGALTGAGQQAASVAPELTEDAQTQEARLYVMSKGYDRGAADKILVEHGVDEVLKSKAAEGKPNTVAPTEPAPAEQVVSRSGEVFDAETHAQHATGEPKTDSTGKFIRIEHDYSPQVPNIPGGK